MAVISFSHTSNDAWKVSRWVFRQFLADIGSNLEDDVEAKQELEYAVALDGLHLYLLDQAVATRIMNAIRVAAKDILSDVSTYSTVSRNYPDRESQQMYYDAVHDLARSLASSK